MPSLNTTPDVARSRAALLLAAMGSIALLVGATGWTGHDEERGGHRLLGGPRVLGAQVRSHPPISGVLGAASCSSTACHGSIAPFPVSESPVFRNEHTTWVSRDPHARAYQVLFDPRSVAISTKLGGVDGRITPAHRDPRCLACHTTPRPEEELAIPSVIHEDGVGCESCHGPAARWIGPHTSAGWRSLSREEKEARYGLLDTKDTFRRALMCAGCHVGSRLDPGLTDRDVNHDLIAAGHPRLAFDFAAFQDLYPKHWSLKDEELEPIASVRAWAEGLKATQIRTVSLTRDRARSESAPWPEFAEYGCFSCHHRLADEPWRLQRSRGEVPPGVPDWSSWALAPERGGYVAQPLALDSSSGPIGQLRELMERLSPDRESVSSLAQEAVTQILSRGVQPASGDLIEQISRLDDAAGWGKVVSWDEAAQRYLALVAHYQALSRVSPEKVPTGLPLRLEELRKKLTFPPGRESPAGFNPANVEP